VLDAGLSALAVEPLRETGHAAVIGVHLAVHDLSMLAITNSDPRSAGGASSEVRRNGHTNSLLSSLRF
jgi:hypothetical protein